ncbi:MAG: alpha/beta hydrolase [Bacteroidales bacterium]
MSLKKILILALFVLFSLESICQIVNVALDDQRVARIYTEIIGEGEPIVIFHRASAGYLEPIFESQTGWKRIYIDPPGVGKSSSDTWIINADVALQVMIRTIQTILPEKQFSIAGFSYFGYMSMGVIKTMPDKVKGTLLTCPVTIPDFNKRDLSVSNYRYTDSTFYATLQPGERALFDGFVYQTETTYKIARDQRRHDVLLDVDFWNTIKQNAYHFSFPVDNITHQGPSLIFLGLQDNVVGFKDGLSLASIFPRGSIVAMDLASHSLPFEQNEAFTLLVTHWLKRIKMVQ